MSETRALTAAHRPQALERKALMSSIAVFLIGIIIAVTCSFAVDGPDEL